MDVGTPARTSQTRQPDAIKQTVPGETQASQTSLPPTARRLLRLQAAAGNHAVARLVQRMGAPSATSIQRDYERAGAAGGVYESERFGPTDSKRERPTFVELPVKSRGTAGREAAPPPLSQFAHGGKLDSGTAGKSGYDGGHVVGLHVGGEDISENVVPMFKAFNRGAYKNMEDQVKLKATGLYKPWITIICHYEDDEADTPYAFEVLLEKTKFGDDTRSAVWQQFLTQPGDIKAVEPLNEQGQKMVRGEVNADLVRSKAGLMLGQSAQQFDLGTYTSVVAYITAEGNLPRSHKGLYPDNPKQRPYQFLDLLSFSGDVSSPGMGAFTDFTGEQRVLILQANMARNGGKIISDDTQDPVPGGVLSERGTVNFPEIDHIVPKSRGGSNMFSNARVVSWQLNNQEDRVKSLFGVIDMTKRALPPLAGMGAKDIPSVVENYLHRANPTGEFGEADVWVWGAQNFPVMSGQQMTGRRRGLIKSSLLSWVVKNQLEQSGSGKFKIKRS